MFTIWKLGAGRGTGGNDCLFPISLDTNYREIWAIRVVLLILGSDVQWLLIIIRHSPFLSFSFPRMRWDCLLRDLIAKEDTRWGIVVLACPVIQSYFFIGDASIGFWLRENLLHQREWRSEYSSSFWVIAQWKEFRQCVLMNEQRKTVGAPFDAVRENSGVSEYEWVNDVLKVGFELEWGVHFHVKCLLLFMGSTWLGRSC